MFEAKLSSSSALVFKKTFEIVKDLVSDTNISCEEDGIRIQAMDSSHVALICVYLKDEFFKRYRCDRAVTLGLSVPSFFKLLKAAKDDDRVKLSVQNEEGDLLRVDYEGRKTNRISSYTLNLLTIDGDDLRIPLQQYDAKVIMSSVEFSSIVKDLMAIHNNVVVDVSKVGFKLEASGDQSKGEVWVKSDVPVKPVNEEEDEDEDGDGHKTLVEEEEEGDHKPSMIKKRKLQESTNVNARTFSPGPPSSPDTKHTLSSLKVKHSHSQGDESEDTSNQTIIQVTSRVSGLTFKLKYLQTICKCSALAETVELLFSPDAPLLVRYNMGKNQGHIRYYLAPQIGDDG